VSAELSPDFTGFSEKQMAFVSEFSISPLVFLHFLLTLLLRLGIRVGLRFLTGAKRQTPPPNKEKLSQVGASESI
jgi:hypothetical protein